jgi:CBS domain containing-hemolysin-like protein
MSDPSQRIRDNHRAERPSVFDRLRSLFVREEASLRDDIEEALEDAAAPGDISPQERAMLKNVLGLHETRVADVMVPRGDIVAVSLEDDLAHVLNVFRTAGHSRIPVYAETLDDPRGMIHIRDFLNFMTSRQAPASDKVQAPFEGIDFARVLGSVNILRPVLFVPPSMPALDLLIKMQSARTHMALVIDEYGGTDGLASIEDLVELIVGDIEDEHDAVEGPMMAPAGPGLWLIDARALLEEVSEAAELDFSNTPHAESVDTVGGLISLVAGRVPAKGEKVLIEGRCEFEIVDADPRRIKKVSLRVFPRGESTERSPGATDPAVSSRPDQD